LIEAAEVLEFDLMRSRCTGVLLMGFSIWVLFGLTHEATAATNPALAMPEEPTPRSYETFRTLPDSQLSLLQVKLSYVGSRKRAGPSTIAFVSTKGHSEDLDRVPSTELSIVPLTTSEMRALLESVAALPEVIDERVDSGEVMFSFAMEGRVEEQDLYFESLLNADDSRELFSNLEATFVDINYMLGSMACRYDLIRGVPPVDATKYVKISFEPFQLDPNSAQGGGTVRVRVTNIGRSELTAPVLLVVDSEPGVQAGNETGLTCLITRPFTPYFRLPVSDSLAPGETVTGDLRYVPMLEKRFSLTGRVFAGPGTP